MQEEIDKSTIKVGDFNTPLAVGQIYQAENMQIIVELNSTINQLNLIES